MVRPVLIPDPENATIEERKQVSRLGSNEAATRCSAIQMLLAGADRQLFCRAVLVTHRTHLLTMKARWFNNHVCKSGENGYLKTEESC
jgi:hypothetical protein